MNPLTRIALMVTMVAVLASCSRERDAWRTAQAADTISAYDEFITKYPQGELAQGARARVRQLAEEGDWQKAALTDTLEAYQVFLLQHPDGRWAQEARIRVENFALDAGDAAPVVAAPAAPAPATATAPARATAAAPADTKVASPAKPVVQAAPAAPVRTAPASTAPTSGAHGIQLGAFGSDTSAMAAWKRMQATYAAQLGQLSPTIEEVRTSTGVLHRLRARVGDEATARSACESLRARGAACIVVRF